MIGMLGVNMSTLVRWRLVGAWLCGCLVFGACPSLAETQAFTLPDEYEAVGGHGLALGNGGAAAQTEASAVRLNPAMLAMSRDYTIGGGYHWPRRGREFYQLSVVDARTGPLVAGLSYTGFASERGTDPKVADWAVDSPLRHRVALGAAHAFSHAALGVSAQWVQAQDVLDATRKVTGITLGLGLAGLLTPTLRAAVSGENITQSKVNDYAPRTFRAGLAYLLAGGTVSLHADYRRRDRVAFFEAAPDVPLALGESAGADGSPGRDQVTKTEDMALGSASAQIQNLIRILGAYGQGVGATTRRSLSGGLALVTDRYALSYSLSRPSLDELATHQAIHLSVAVAL